MPSDSVMIICDDQKIGNIWSYVLGQINISTQHNPLITLKQDFLEIPMDQPFGLVLMDQSITGLELIPLVQGLRDQVVVPILLLIPVQDESYMLKAYSAGVNECIAKPISPQLLQAKVKSWLNRSWTIPVVMLDNFHVGDIQLNPTQRQFIDADGTAVKLTNLEYRLLHLLMSYPGRFLATDFIVGRVWGYDAGDNLALLKNVIYRLRRKIEADPGNPRFILSSKGEGYLFQI